jgi:ubiquinone/menaquinone biosynthesis C-methylase UbiE
MRATTDMTAIDFDSPLEFNRQLIAQSILLSLEALPEFTDHRAIRNVLDIACGPGGWALDVAVGDPDKRVTGIDRRATMVDFARASARVRGLQNVQFRCMDAREGLDFPDSSFDLINASCLSEFLLKPHWVPLLRECRRILRPGGILRLTEYEVGMSNAPAHEEVMKLFLKSMFQSDRSFSPDGRHIGLIFKLHSFLEEAGFGGVYCRSYHLDYSSGCPLHEPWTEVLLTLLDLALPFMVGYSSATREEVQFQLEQMAQQMRRRQFCALWPFLTALGTRPKETADNACRHGTDGSGTQFD